MRVVTSELTGKQLIWAVAHCEAARGGYAVELRMKGTEPNHPFLRDVGPSTAGGGFYPCYDTDWKHGGPIIEREIINPRSDVEEAGRYWWADIYEGGKVTGRTLAREYGPTLLIAAMRCYVAFKLGSSVEIPDELATA